MLLRWPHLVEDHFLHELDFRVCETDVAGVDAIVELDLLPARENGMGALQGGLVATLVDIAAAQAIKGYVPEGSGYATQDLSCHYLDGIREGPTRAVARVRRHGRRAAVVQMDVLDAGADDRVCVVATVTYAILRRD